jgi:hypothetical protein
MSLGDPSRRMFDDGAGMHEYLLCTILDCGSDPKDLLVERATMFTAQSIGLIWVGLVEQHVVFPVLRIFRAKGQYWTSWT